MESGGADVELAVVDEELLREEETFDLDERAEAVSNADPVTFYGTDFDVFGLVRRFEGGDILVVGKSCRKADKTHIFVRLFHATDCPCYDTFKDWAALVVEEMDFVNDDEANEVGVAGVCAFASNDVPLLWGRHDDLGLRYLLLGHL